MPGPERHALRHTANPDAAPSTPVDEARTPAWSQKNDHQPVLERTSMKLPSVDIGPGADLKHTMAEIAHKKIGQSVYRPLAGSHYEPGEVTPKFGCTSTVTNLMFEAMLKRGMVTPKQYGDFHEINVTDFIKKALGQNIIQPVSHDKANEGDLIVGEDSSGRHMGILTRDGRGHLKVANNYGGILREDDIQQRFGAFPKVTYYRPTGNSPK